MRLLVVEFARQPAVIVAGLSTAVMFWPDELLLLGDLPDERPLLLVDLPLRVGHGWPSGSMALIRASLARPCGIWPFLA